MSSTILTNRSMKVNCEVTYEDPDLIVGMIVYGFDENLQEFVELERKRAKQAGINSYGAFFIPTVMEQFITELMVFNETGMLTRNFSFGISSRSFTVDTSLPDQIASVSALISGLSSLVQSNPPTGIIGIVDNGNIIAKIITPTDTVI